VIIPLNDQQLRRFKEYIEGCDYCYLCGHHPGKWHHGHDPSCPLRELWHKEDCAVCAERLREGIEI
jgi:hypothetical protein